MTLALFLTGVMSFANPAFSQTDVETVAAKQKTATPIKPVIVLIGENRTFDHLFATYVSPSEDSVNNLLSEGIIKADIYCASSQFRPPLKSTRSRSDLL